MFAGLNDIDQICRVTQVSCVLVIISGPPSADAVHLFVDLSGIRRL